MSGAAAAGRTQPALRPTSIVALGVLGIAALGGAAVGLAPAPLVSVVVAVTAMLAVAHRLLLDWTRLMALLVAVILFIPIRRYTFAFNLPFELEPYRVTLALLLAGWVTSLLMDPNVRLRRSGLEMPVALIAVATLASVIANPDRVEATSSFVTKALMFLAGFLAFLFMVVSLVRGQSAVDRILKVLVGGASILAVFAVIESRTGFNPFDHLQGWIPGIKLGDTPFLEDRGGRLRTIGSAQHPIALSALLAMMVPLAIYLRIRTRRNVWIGAALLLVTGVSVSVSRTGILMLVAIVAVFLALRPMQTRQFWPLLIPAFVVIQLAAPGTLGSLRQAFFPAGGLIAEQRAAAGTVGSGRVADLGPALAEWSQRPLFGEGFGTRIVDVGLQSNAFILDDQWMVTLLEIGALGAVAWLWLFWRSVRRMGGAARRDPTDRGWLLTALTAAVAAFAAGMFTYDAFSFIQVTFVAILLIALGASIVESGAERLAPAGGGGP